MHSLRGSLLIATPHLRDPNFMQSVVLIIEHEHEGALGVILNRPLELSVGELWQQFDAGPCSLDSSVRCGGPVTGPILAIHPFEQFSDKEVLPGVHFTNDRDALKTLVNADLTPVLIFAGYSGWGSEQLEGELNVGGWLVLPASSSLIFEHDTESLWNSVIRRTGQDFLTASLGIHRFPDDPAVN
jgi:putative transcriptional regulator